VQRKKGTRSFYKMPQQHVSGSEQIWMNLHLPYKYLYQFTTNCKFVYYFAPARQVRVPPVLLAQ
jgi:hypothetical protein